MNPYWQFFLAVATFLLLATSLLARKKAGWSAVAGLSACVTLAVCESDPVLILGALALVAVRFLKIAPKDSHTDSKKGAVRNRS